MKLTVYFCLFAAFGHFTNAEKQDYAPVRYAVQDKSISLPCAYPSEATYLKWVFRGNGSDFSKDAAQVFPGNMPTIFLPFNTPSGRSELEGGTLIINEVLVGDEGDYWCEISSVGVSTQKSRIYPVHVYVTPTDPEITSLSNSTLTEYKNSTIARCSSQGGKPGSKLTWMNGSIPVSSQEEVVYRVNAFKKYLTDADVDLKIINPTRYDHNRVFSCVIEHPAYDENKVLNYSIKVMYHPIKIKVWANLTSLFVFCEAESFPNPTYHWKMPGGLTGFTGPSLYVADLYDLPGGEQFECIASNGIPPNATIRVRIDDLLYPDGKPGWLGLDWWVWGAILGGVVALVVIVIIIIYCCRKKKSGQSKTNHKSPAKKPIIKNVEYIKTPQHPTSLSVDVNYRTPDGREDSFDSRTPSPVNQHKQALIDGVFNQSRENITLIPNEELRRSRENMYSDNRRSMHASREQLDMVASHIATLNKSWDQLSKSRQALNETQDEIQQASANLSKSREALYHSREALNRGNEQDYPYIDDGTTRSNEYSSRPDGRYEDQHDGFRQPPPAYDYDGRDSTYNSRHRNYDGDQQGYGDTGHYDGGHHGYDTYTDNRYDGYQDDNRGGHYDGYNQDARYDDSRYGDGYDYRDDRRADRYDADRYYDRDEYPPRRIV